jgi:hypothetical protein
MPEMRDGTTVEDPRLGRLKERDERSRNFSVAALDLPTELRSKTWGVPGTKLDQGTEGACVGFGVTHELIAYPMSNLGLTNKFAREQIYWEAQRKDPWAGGSYPGATPVYEGTSVLSGIKVAKSLGYFGGYRWCFTIDDLCRTLAWEGPVVIGIDWLSGMDNVRPSGRVIPSGSVRGGHCVVLTGITLHPRLAGEPSIPMLRGRNSWGEYWGRGGDFFVAVEDFENKLMSGADMVIPVDRKKLPLPTQAPKARPYQGGHSNRSLVDWKNVRGWRVA